MLGVLANTGAVLLGGALGLLCKKGIPEKLSGGVIKGLALVTLYLGVSGMIKGENQLVTVLSVILGGALGTLLDLDGRLNRFAQRVSQKFGGDSKFAIAFVTTSLLYCVGAMAVMGSINAGLNGDNGILYAKSIMDGTSAVVFAASLGVGVLCSALPLLIIQGGIALLSGLIAPYLDPHAVAEITCVGSILIFGLGLNLLEITKLKVVDYLPGVVLAAVLAQFM